MQCPVNRNRLESGRFSKHLRALNQAPVVASLCMQISSIPDRTTDHFPYLASIDAALLTFHILSISTKSTKTFRDIWILRRRSFEIVGKFRKVGLLSA